MVAEGSTWKTPSGEVLRLREVLVEGTLFGTQICLSSTQDSHRAFPVFQVWQDNLEEELSLIRDVIEDYPYLAMGEIVVQQPVCCQEIVLNHAHSACNPLLPAFFPLGNHNASRQKLVPFSAVTCHAADTEFPGIVARPVGNYKSGEFHYQTLRWDSLASLHTCTMK